MAVEKLPAELPGDLLTLSCPDISLWQIKFPGASQSKIIENLSLQKGFNLES